MLYKCFKKCIEDCKILFPYGNQFSFVYAPELYFNMFWLLLDSLYDYNKIIILILKLLRRKWLIITFFLEIQAVQTDALLWGAKIGINY